MPTDLEELVEFISHGKPQIRQLAVENLIPYSLSQPDIFKTNDLTPIKDLKVLVRDHEKIAKDALTILINLSTYPDILSNLATDHDFITNTLLARVTKPKEPNANEIAMLLANLAKSDAFLKDILSLTRSPPAELSSSTRAIDQLLDLFVRGADGTYNRLADYDYLSYLFADLAKQASGRSYFLTAQPYDQVIPLTKLSVFTEHRSAVRRRGVASALKNVAFEVASHAAMLAEGEGNLLPYLLLPLAAGGEDYDDDDEEDSLDMLPDLQLLPADKRREPDPRTLQTHVETLTLLTTTRGGRDRLRALRVYPVVRETHLQVEDDGVREACERLVQVLMRDEEGEEGKGQGSADGKMKPLERRSASGGAPANGGGMGGRKPFGRAGWATQAVKEKRGSKDDDADADRHEHDDDEDDDDEDDDDDKIVEV